MFLKILHETTLSAHKEICYTIVTVQADKSCRLSDCVPASDIEIVKRKEGYDEQTKHIMLY